MIFIIFPLMLKKKKEKKKERRKKRGKVRSKCVKEIESFISTMDMLIVSTSLT